MAPLDGELITIMDALERDNQLAEMLRQAQTKYQEGAQEDAIQLMRMVVLLYAELDTEEIAFRQRAGIRKSHAIACELCADLLMEQEQYPEAATLFQEAVDGFGSLTDSISLQKAEDCAHKTVLAINSLRAKPHERLQLLIAHHERKLQQLRLHGGTSIEQAKVQFQIAQIFLRRERYPDSRTRFALALSLFENGNPDAQNALNRAECQHQLGNLALYRFEERHSAYSHYEQALQLYQEASVLDEFDASAPALCRLALKEIMAHLADSSPAFGEGRLGQ